MTSRIAFDDTSTPVVTLQCGLGALSIARSLGSLGVAVYCVQVDDVTEATFSRYCRKSFRFPYDSAPFNALADFLSELRTEFDKPPILIACSDETAILVAENHERLSRDYLIAQNAGDIVHRLADKMGMFSLAREHGVPAPATILPADAEEARCYAESANYPVMLKGAMGNKLYARTGKKMVVVNDTAELMEQYSKLEDPSDPNLMIQELIPGDDDQVYIFNGYFDKDSKCLAAFTGRKIRQYPIHVGCASLGECSSVPDVAELTISFMKKIGYRGVLDIGFRKDPRDGSFKVLDINPRVGQAFRLFVAENDMDVVRALYVDLTGGVMPPVVPREGRRWLIEDYDLISSVDYYRERSLSLTDWLKSFRRVEEGAWFALRDPLPFLRMSGRLGKRAVSSCVSRIVGRS